MTDMKITKLICVKSVMDLLPSPDQDAELRVTFVSAYDDTEAIYRTVILNFDEWRDLGSPEQITVTVCPGDQLNES
jgi:hypothetical protein